jgi:CBS domain-containing protein
MSQNVVMVPQEMSVQGAARLLGRAQVTGAPVVNAEGRCVGVLSATDFVHYAEGENIPRKKGCREQHSLCSAWQIMDDQEYPERAVMDLMTSDPVNVAPSATIGELARMMLDAHIHRVIVVDKQERPVGVVSATDILAAVAYADRNQNE